MAGLSRAEVESCDSLFVADEFLENWNKLTEDFDSVDTNLDEIIDKMFFVHTLVPFLNEEE